MPPDAGGPGAEPRPLPTGFSPLEEADPRTIGPFRVVGRIGAGGMGAVYGALDGADRHVAVKVVHPRHADDPAFREQFAREAELLARVDAECAPAFYGADPHAETPWMATEFVPGRTLSGHVRERGVLGGRALLSFAAGTAEALAAIHAAGIVHRDVKPANVILAPGGPKVLDFGIARAADDRTPEEGVYGTPGWVAPERLAGEPETPGADVFAWGGLVVYAATGRGPFGTGDAAELVQRTRTAEPDLDGVPDELLPVVFRALSRDPADRPGAAEALAEVLALTGADAARGGGERERLRGLLRAAWTGFEAVRGAGPWIAAAGSAAALTGAAAVAGAGAAATGAAATGVAPAGAAGAAGGAASAGALGGTAAGAGTVAGVSKATAAIVAPASVAAIGAGGWVAGRLYTGEPILPLGAEASEEPGEPEGERVEYRGMSLPLPEGWAADTVEEEFGVLSTPGERVTEEWLVLYPEGQEGCAGVEWSWTEVSTGCEHVKVLGPGGIAYGSGGYAPLDGSDLSYSYNPSSNPSPCPEGVPVHDEGDEGYRGPQDWDEEARDLGGEEAVHAEGSALCFPMDGGAQGGSDFRYHVQRMWLVEEREILIVDDYGLEALDGALEGVEWEGEAGGGRQTVEYRTMTLEVPGDWQVVEGEARYSPFGGDPVTDEWVLLGTDPDEPCGAGAEPGAADCPHVLLLGPGAIATGNENGPLDESLPYHPSTGVVECPARAEDAGAPPEQAESLAPIGSLMAYHRTWTIDCLDAGAGGPSSYRQRYWLLPESEILVVDEYGTGQLARILRAADA